MDLANDNHECADADQYCCGSVALINGDWRCSFHRLLDEMMILVCTGETHPLFDNDDEAIEWLEASFDRANPDSMRIENIDLPRICSACTYKAEKDE